MSSKIASKALALLGSGISAEAVASAVGVTPSTISQMLADESFAAQVTELRFAAVSSHNKRDTDYDELEDDLLARLKKNIAFLIKPRDILGAIKVINGATRRGQSATNNIVNQQNIVQITMPKVITQTFVTNVNNQVVSTGEKSLLTMQSGDLLKQVEVSQDTALIEHIDIEETNPETIPEYNEVLAVL